MDCCSRRLFMKSGALALLGVGSVPRFLVRTAYAEGTAARPKILIALFQRGAVDGLSMIVPHGDRVRCHEPRVTEEDIDPEAEDEDDRTYVPGGQADAVPVHGDVRVGQVVHDGHLDQHCAIFVTDGMSKPHR